MKTFYAIDPSSGPITINIQSTADELQDYYCSALAFAVSNVNTTSPFDGVAQTSIGRSSMPQDTITAHYSNDFIVGALGIDDLNPAITSGSGFRPNYACTELVRSLRSKTTLCLDQFGVNGV